ncbi:MAG: hypothetical protein EOO03_02190 [Chitinophagaceae bacterium]|nr:MAG: hypothetical protein EOO03_02190 [Chitinophagaceae bacterium]
MLTALKKITLGTTFFLLFAFNKSATAQYFYNENYYNTDLLFELGGSIGAMNCLTDIGGTKGFGGKFTKDLNMGNTNMVAGIYFGALYQDKVGLRLEANFGKVSAHDSVLVDVPMKDIARARYNRNLSFRSNITEVSLIAEIYPLSFIDWEMKDKDPPRLSPYVMGGVGYFKFNPQANLNGTWVNLQPLSTEGQGFKEYPDRKPYDLNGISIPFGGGIKYEVSPLLNIRAEFLYRPTNTDYLDDVSTTYIDKDNDFLNNGFTGARFTNAYALTDRQRGEYAPQTLPGKKRGNPNDNDNFFSVNLKVGLLLGRERVR